MLTTARRNWFIDVVWLTTVFLIFYCLWLGSYPLFTPDEGRYSAVAREMLFSHDYITPRLDGIPFLDKPVLYYWLQALAMHLFGINEWALRFFPMLLGVLSCVVMYTCARLNFNRRTGILSALILATMPLYFSGAHYANLDLEVAALISMTLLFFITAIRTQMRGFFFAAYTCSALAFLTKGLIGIAFPAMIAGSWIVLTWQWNLLKQIYLPHGILLFLLLVSPWYIFVQRANPDFFHFFFVTQQVTRFLSAGDFNNENAIWFYIPVIFIGAFPWSVYLIQALIVALKTRAQNSTVLFLLLWFAIILVFFSIPHSKTVGYILSIFPALALLIAYYLDQVWESRNIKQQRFARINFILLSILFGSVILFIAYKERLGLTSDTRPYLYFNSSLLLIAGLIATRIRDVKKFIYLCLSTSILFLLALTASAPTLNQTTAKPLLSDLTKLRRPQDEVVNYFKFYQDIPVYLGERITLVADWDSPDIPYRDNWVRELWFGRLAQKKHDILIDEKTFLSRWNSTKRLFVFLNANYLSQFQLQVKNYYFIRRYNDIILVSNKKEREYEGKF